MTHFQCPACGDGVDFKSSISLYAVCPSCGSTLVRHDRALESLGKMAQILDDLTPLQIGTRGVFREQPFELVGRLRLKWDDGFWNEWFALFDDGSTGWLAEAQGSLMISFEEENPGSLPPRDTLKVGMSITLSKGRSYTLDDIKEATCIGSEGELPFHGAVGRKSISADLTGENQTFACLDYSENEPPRAYLGYFVESERLELSELRELDGW